MGRVEGMTEGSYEMEESHKTGGTDETGGSYETEDSILFANTKNRQIAYIEVIRIEVRKREEEMRQEEAMRQEGSDKAGGRDETRDSRLLVNTKISKYPILKW